VVARKERLGVRMCEMRGMVCEMGEGEGGGGSVVCEEREEDCDGGPGIICHSVRHQSLPSLNLLYFSRQHEMTLTVGAVAPSPGK